MQARGISLNIGVGLFWICDPGSAEFEWGRAEYIAVIRNIAREKRAGKRKQYRHMADNTGVSVGQRHGRGYCLRDSRMVCLK